MGDGGGGWGGCRRSRRGRGRGWERCSLGVLGEWGLDVGMDEVGMGWETYRRVVVGRGEEVEMAQRVALWLLFARCAIVVIV